MENIYNTRFYDKKLYFMFKFQQFQAIPGSGKIFQAAQKMRQVFLHGLGINFKHIYGVLSGKILTKSTF